jgi:hypothetical protein
MLHIQLSDCYLFLWVDSLRICSWMLKETSRYLILVLVPYPNNLEYGLFFSHKCIVRSLQCISCDSSSVCLTFVNISAWLFTWVAHDIVQQPNHPSFSFSCETTQNFNPQHVKKSLGSFVMMVLIFFCRQMAYSIQLVELQIMLRQRFILVPYFTYIFLMTSIFV